jgi:quercetin dioxygenase-like cupin family protein
MIFPPSRLSAPLIVAALAWSLAASAQNAPGPIRTVLHRQETTAPGYEAVQIRVEIPVGGREGRHTHPGVAMGYVEQGTLTLEYEGRPAKEYKQGDTFVLEAGKVHEGINKGDVPVKAIATFVVTKGAALTTPAK